MSVPASDRLSPVWTLWLPLAFLLGQLLAVHLDRPFYDEWIDGEEGVLEMLQSFTTAAGFVLAVLGARLALRQERGWLAAYFILAAVCCFYVTGEELSWGQHLLGWETPLGWAEINDQEETNLHNLGTLLNELPRHLLSGAVLVGGLALPLLGRVWPRLYRLPQAIVLPPVSFWPIALLSGLSGLSREKFLYDGELLGHGSEAQESYLYWFVLLYLIVLRRRVKALPARGEAARAA